MISNEAFKELSSGECQIDNSVLPIRDLGCGDISTEFYCLFKALEKNAFPSVSSKKFLNKLNI
jgi:hypothetical protein